MASRRAEATWIESKGYWQIKVQKDGTRKAFTSSVKGRKGKHAAEAKADEWLENGTSDMRFSAAWGEYIKYVKANTGTSNYTNMESCGRLYLLPLLEFRKLSTIRPIDWQKCLDSAADHGLSQRSIKNIRAAISAFLHYARKSKWQHDYIDIADLKIRNSAAPEKEKTILNPADIDILFGDPTYLYRNKKTTAFYINAWRLYVVTGLRRGELAGLQRADIGKQSITIRRNINRFGEETSGKNDNARRTFALTSAMRVILADQVEMLRNAGISTKWVSPDQHGERANPNTIYKSFKRYCDCHGITSTIHTLRHTFVSILKADIPVERIKTVVGHSASMDTIRIYGHELDGEQSRTGQLIESVFDNILSPTDNMSK